MKLLESESKLSNTALKILHCTPNIAHYMYAWDVHYRFALAVPKISKTLLAGEDILV